MSSQIKKLNEELFQDFEKNKKVNTQTILIKLTKLKRLIRKQINQHKCSWCEETIKGFKDKTSSREYLISGLCQDCQNATFKEVN